VHFVDDAGHPGHMGFLDFSSRLSHLTLSADREGEALAPSAFWDLNHLVTFDLGTGHHI
jgi:hypothetical protein